MREIKIPKRNGKYRLVVDPGTAKNGLRQNLPWVQLVAMMLDVHDVQHGFVPCRSPVTNAEKHIGFAWTVSFDLEDCFDHVTLAKVGTIFGQAPGGLFHKGVARQGLPTSPSLCNIALSQLDDEIVTCKIQDGEVYTRYADDLTFSVQSRERVDSLLASIPQLCDSHGFPVNKDKTHVQSAAAGRRIITGVAVGDTGIHPTRAVKRRLRAARHHKNKNQASGLAEWCKLKRPDWQRYFQENVTRWDDRARNLAGEVAKRECDR